MYLFEWALICTSVWGCGGWAFIRAWDIGGGWALDLRESGDVQTYPCRFSWFNDLNGATVGLDLKCVVKKNEINSAQKIGKNSSSLSSDTELRKKNSRDFGNNQNNCSPVKPERRTRSPSCVWCSSMPNSKRVGPRFPEFIFSSNRRAKVKPGRPGIIAKGRERIQVTRRGGSNDTWGRLGGTNSRTTLLHTQSHWSRTGDVMCSDTVGGTGTESVCGRRTGCRAAIFDVHRNIYIQSSYF